MVAMKNIILIFAVLISTFSIQVYSQNDKAGSESIGKVYDVVDKKPYIVGFKRDIEKYFKQSLKYPDDAFIAGIEGVVYVSFVVTDTGSVGDVYISQSSQNIFNGEAIRVVKNTSGHWRAGLVDGKSVNTRMVTPVKFELSDKDLEAVELLSSFDETKGKPLFVLDDKIVTGIIEIEDYNIQSVRVIKGKKAIELYGDRGKNGVVIITSKNGATPVY